MKSLTIPQQTALALIAKDKLFDHWLSLSQLSLHLATARKTAMSLVKLGLLELNDDNRRFRLTSQGREYIETHNPHFDSRGKLVDNSDGRVL